MFKYLVLKPDGSRTEVEMEDKISLEMLQKTVGGYIEVVKVGKGHVAVINEEGRLKGLKSNAYMPEYCGNIVIARKNFI